jgi:hypothetical protein
VRPTSSWTLPIEPDADRQRVDEETEHAVGAVRACSRPESVVPKTTSSRSVQAASTRAQAAWNSTAAETPCARAVARRPAASSARERAGRLVQGLLHAGASSTPNGAVGSSTSASRSRKYASWSAADCERSCAMWAR